LTFCGENENVLLSNSRCKYEDKISSFVFVEAVVLKCDVSNMDKDGENEHLIN